MTTRKESFAELEMLLEQKPDDIDSRMVLIRNYRSQLGSPDNQRRWNVHVMWMIENYPNEPFLGGNHINFSNWPADYEAAKALWLDAVSKCPDDVTVLRNAVTFLFVRDRAIAETIVRKGMAIAPGAIEWHVALALARRMDWHEESSPKKRIELARESLAEYRIAFDAENSSQKSDLLLVEIMKASCRAGEFDAAASIAKVILSKGGSDSMSQKHAWHFAHIAVGHLALSRNDVVGAVFNLRQASGTGASFAAGELFGPDLTLADALLGLNEYEAVDEYLGVCRECWPHAEDVSAWIHAIRSGIRPSLRLQSSGI